MRQFYKFGRFSVVNPVVLSKPSDNKLSHTIGICDAHPHSGHTSDTANNASWRIQMIRSSPQLLHCCAGAESRSVISMTLQHTAPLANEVRFFPRNYCVNWIFKKKINLRTGEHRQKAFFIISDFSFSRLRPPVNTMVHTFCMKTHSWEHLYEMDILNMIISI